MTRTDILRLFAYTEWANGLALDSCDQLTAEQLHHDFGSGHHSIFETLVHMIGAERIWLERWQGVVPRPFARPEEFKLVTDIGAEWQTLERERAEFLTHVSDATLNDQLTYTNLRGEKFSQPLIDQMQHVVNHATHHRGQVIAFVRSFGVKPANTDLIHYLRTVV